MKTPCWRLPDLQPVVGRLHEILEGQKGKELQASDAQLRSGSPAQPGERDLHLMWGTLRPSLPAEEVLTPEFVPSLGMKGILPALCMAHFEFSI